MGKTRYDIALTQQDIDGAYAVKVFLDYHPERALSFDILTRQTGITEERLKAAFLYQFKESLKSYLEKTLSKNEFNPEILGEEIDGFVALINEFSPAK
jgi:hypothetical protein